MQLQNINLATIEGRLLLAALAIITTTTHTDKTPDEVIGELDLKQKDMYPDPPTAGADLQRLEGFKTFVHGALTEMGIPENPGGRHTQAGCRIGDRLDLVHAIRLYEAIDILKAELSKDTAPGSYYHAWQSNIAMSFHDAMKKALDSKELQLGPDAVAFSIHDMANEAAKNFLDMLISQNRTERRQLYTMTPDEMVGLLQAATPPDMEEKPDADEYAVEMFHNDGGNMVDSDVAIGANVSCRCFTGQLAITQDGSINFYGEDGEGLDRFPYQWKAFQYLVGKGFDLDNILLTEPE